MTKLDIDLLTRLEAEAMVGPWVVDGLIPYRVQQDNFDPHVVCVSDPKCDYHPGMTSCCNNAVFIAAMRNAMPLILKRLRAAEALREAVEYSWHGCTPETRKHCDMCLSIAKYDRDISDGE